MFDQYKLKLLVVYGSQAKNTADKFSDIDLAVLGHNNIDFSEIVDITNMCMDIFSSNKIDLKSLHHQSPLFLYEVMMNSRLLNGTEYDYESLKSYVFKLYNDSRDLLQIKESIIKKRLSKLNDKQPAVIGKN